MEATIFDESQKQLLWFCDSFDSSRIDAKQNEITTSANLDAQKCKSARKKTAKFSPSSNSVDFDKILLSNFNSSNIESGNNKFNSREWITLYNYGTYMQKVSLRKQKENSGDGKVSNWRNVPLSCPLSN